MKLAMYMDKIKSPQNESHDNLNSHAVPENLLPCTSKASITVFNATSQRISILISLPWCGVTFTTIVVAMYKLLWKNKGDVSDRQWSLAPQFLLSLKIRQALHQVLHSADRITCYLVFETCNASSSCQIDCFFSKNKELWKLVTSSVYCSALFCMFVFFLSNHKGKS